MNRLPAVEVYPTNGFGSGPRGYPPLSHPDSVEPHGIPFREYLSVLRRNLWLVGLTTLVAGAIAVYRVSTEKPLYRAGAVIRLADARQALAGNLGGGGVEQLMGAGADPLLSQIQVLKSRGIAEAVAERTPLRLHSLTEGFSAGHMGEVWVSPEATADTLRFQFGPDAYGVSSAAGQSSASYGDPVELAGVRLAVVRRPEVLLAMVEILPFREAVATATANLYTGPRDRTDVVDIQFTATDPAVAAAVVNAFAETFQIHSATTAQQQSRRRHMFVEEQLRTTDSVLASAQLALTDFRSSRQVYSSQEMLSAQQQGMMGLEVRREELTADRRMYSSLLGQLQGSGPERRSESLRTLVSTPGIASNPVVAQLFGQLMQYQAARDSMTTSAWAAAESHPDVRRIDGLLTSTEDHLVSAVRSHISALDARITALQELHARNAAGLQTLPTSEAQEMRLLREVETAARMADALREELQRARIAEAVEAGQVEIVDLASAPASPIATGKTRTVLFGLMIGFMLGGGGAILRERMNTSIRRKEDMEASLRVPGLAIIPQIGSNGGARRLPWRIGNGKGNGARPRGAGMELVTLSDGRTSGAEAFRTLRTNLLFSQSIETIQTLVVTSASPGEGKTTTAANLAVAYAQQGIKVLLIDCDLRKPRLHKVFATSSEPGLTHVVLGSMNLAGAVRETPVAGLYFLPGGQLPPNPAEFLGGERMKQLLQTASESFDMIVLDSPPLLAASDAAILGSRVDGVLLVVKAGHTARAAGQHAIEQLQNVGARVVGAVLNDPDAQVAQYGDHYHNYEYYGAND